MKRTGVIYYPAYLKEVAVYIGRLRSLYNTNIRNTNITKYSRKEKNDYVDILGVLGELIFLQHLFQCGITYKTTDLLNGRPVVECDVEINGKKVDVKTMPHASDRFLVNKEAHKKKKVDVYVFVKPVAGETKAQYWIIPYAEVSNWEVKNAGYTDAYYCQIADYEAKRQSTSSGG